MAIVGSFIGESIHTINSAGRISIPSKFRDVLKGKYGDESLVLVTITDHIIAYPMEEWEKVESKWDENPPVTKSEMWLYREMHRSAEVVTIDKQGRVLVPQLQREKCKLEDECAIIGLRDRIEIWSKPLWDQEMAGGEELLAGGVNEIFNDLIL